MTKYLVEFRRIEYFSVEVNAEDSERAYQEAICTDDSDCTLESSDVEEISVKEVVVGHE